MGSKWIKGGEAAWSAIKGVLPEVNRTKTGTAIGKLKVESHKLKMKGAKLKQTIFDIQQKKKKKNWKDHVDTSHPSYKKNWPPGE